MDRLTAVKVLLDVAQTESFTATSERLDISRPMVTRNVEAVENWLGARLLQRTTRKVSLTSVGEQMLPELQRWVEQALLIEENLMPKQSLQGFVRISVSMSFGFSMLMPALQQFRQQYPGIKIDIDAQDRAVDMVSERIDLAIRTTNDPDPALVGRCFAICHSKLVASPEYLASHPEIAHPTDLTKHSCLGYKNFGRHVWQLTKGEQKHKIKQINTALSLQKDQLVMHTLSADYLQWHLSSEIKAELNGRTPLSAKIIVASTENQLTLLASGDLTDLQLDATTKGLYPLSAKIKADLKTANEKVDIQKQQVELLLSKEQALQEQTFRNDKLTLELEKFDAQLQMLAKFVKV